MVEADQLRAPAELEDRGHHPVGGGDREQVHRRRLDRHQQRAEGEQQDDEAERDDDRDHLRQLVADLGGEVDVAGGLAADVGGAAGPLRRLRDDFVAKFFDQVDGVGVPWRGLRDNREDGDRPLLVEGRLADFGDVAVSR